VRAVFAWLGRRAELGSGVVQAVTMQFGLLLVEETLLSTGCMKLRATCLGVSSFKLAQSRRNLYPAWKESF